MEGLEWRKSQHPLEPDDEELWHNGKATGYKIGPGLAGGDQKILARGPMADGCIDRLAYLATPNSAKRLCGFLYRSTYKKPPIALLENGDSART